MIDGAKATLPTWYADETINRDVVLSDDLDGLVSTSLLRAIKGWNVQYFYNFKGLYASDKAIAKPLDVRQDDRVWCDVSILFPEKCFDNHVNQADMEDIVNPNAINPNYIKHCTNKDYINKYSGSTALLIWSLYDYPLPKTEEGKMLLLSIDGAYKGYYDTKYEREFYRSNRFCMLRIFGFDELFEVQKRHKIEDFDEVKDKYNISDKIVIKDGKLSTKLDINAISDALGLELHLPDIRFVELLKLGIFRGYPDNRMSTLPNHFITGAYTYANKISASYIIEDRKAS